MVTFDLFPYGWLCAAVQLVCMGVVQVEPDNHQCSAGFSSAASVLGLSKSVTGPPSAFCPVGQSTWDVTVGNR
jgi:hypothetical protein